MAREHSIKRYRRCYAGLLRLYPKSYYERFGESMAQTFTDLLRERASEEKRLLGCALWMFAETFTSLLRENMVQNRNTIRIALGTALILLVPFLAMQITDEVAWDPADFAVAGLLLFSTGFVYDRVARKGASVAYRVATGVAVAIALILVWMNLAVGIIGSEGDPANLMYVGVLSVGIVGAIIARFQPLGMARALFATALAQVLVGLIALLAGLGFMLLVNGAFAALWVGSALLFRRAVRPPQPA